MLLYHIRVLEDLEEYSEALSLLDVNAKSRAIIDRVAIMEYRGAINLSYSDRLAGLNSILARILARLDQHDDAEQTWQALIEQNPDSYEYYQGFFRNRGLDLCTVQNFVNQQTSD